MSTKIKYDVVRKDDDSKSIFDMSSAIFHDQNGLHLKRRSILQRHGSFTRISITIEPPASAMLAHEVPYNVDVG